MSQDRLQSNVINSPPTRPQFDDREKQELTAIPGRTADVERLLKPVNIIRDEDDMKSDDPHALATQQSIKAYVDANSGSTPAASTCYIETGEYTGDGATSHVISLTDTAMVVKFVECFPRITTTDVTLISIQTTDTIVDDSADGQAIYDGPTYHQSRTNHIIATGTGSFTVDDKGTDEDPNKNGVVYNYIAMGTH